MWRKCQLDYMLINATRGYDLTSKPKTLEALQNALQNYKINRDLSSTKTQNK